MKILNKTHPHKLRIYQVKNNKNTGFIKGGAYV